jgi:hypothetical protein
MKQMLKPYLLVLCMGLALSACGGKQSPAASQVTNVDKDLSCEELQLEMNDADYIRQTAEKNKGLSARNILWPFGYPATYMSADEALESANRRLAYLQKVYNIKNCKRALY